MSKYTTVVIRMPEDAEGKKQVEQALNLLKPHQTAMSLEDEMTVLELVEQHEDFQSYIADEARAKTAELHAAAEAVLANLGCDPMGDASLARQVMAAPCAAGRLSNFYRVEIIDRKED